MLTALIRAAILYLFIVVGFRLMGKRQIGELEPSELVLSLLIADLASVPMQDFGIPLFYGVLPILVLLSISSILSALSVKSLRIRTLLNGRPSIVIENGKIIPTEMKKNRFTTDELIKELRLCGYVDLKKIKYAILETSGQVSMIPYASEQPPTSKQMNLSPVDSGLPLTIISDGRIIRRNLILRNLDVSWLNQELARMGLRSPQEVLLTIDENNVIYCTEKNRQKNNTPDSLILQGRDTLVYEIVLDLLRGLGSFIGRLTHKWPTPNSVCSPH